MVRCSAAVAPAGALVAAAVAEGFADAEADSAPAGCVATCSPAACLSAVWFTVAGSPVAVQAASADNTTTASESRPATPLAFSRAPVALPRNVPFRRTIIARITLPFCHAAPPGGAAPHGHRRSGSRSGKLSRFGIERQLVAGVIDEDSCRDRILIGFVIIQPVIISTVIARA